VDKVEGEEQRETAVMRRGKRLEEVVVEEFVAQTGYEVTLPECIYQHPEHGYMIANPDRLVFETPGRSPDLQPVHTGLEAKTGGGFNPVEWEAEPPDYVLIQVQHQIAVMDWTHCYVGLLTVNDWSYRQWRIERDDRAIEFLIEQERLFWVRVETHAPPPTDPSPSTSKALNRLYRNAIPEKEVDLGDLGARMLRARAVAKVEAEQASNRLDRLTNAIKALMGDATVGMIGGAKACTLPSVKNARLDIEALAQAHPEIVAEFTKDNPYRRLSVSKQWKEATDE
jgi:predicted phage-related endonuclease